MASKSGNNIEKRISGSSISVSIASAMALSAAASCISVMLA
jgi:hypothetical protein